MAKKIAATRAAISRNYFLTYLVPTTYTDSEIRTIKDGMTSLVSKHQGRVVSNTDWGKKKMAYKIKHAGKWYTDAVYVHLVVELPASEVNALERDVYLNTQIMRHLLVIADEAEETTPEVISQAK